MARQYKDWETQAAIADAAANALREAMFKSHQTMTLEEVSSLMGVVREAVRDELREIESEHFRDAIRHGKIVNEKTL